MWLRKTKSKEEKLVDSMTAKVAQIEKLKNEVNEMGKLILKDGRLQKVEDVPKQVVQPQPTQEEVMEAKLEQEARQFAEQHPMPQMPRPIPQNIPRAPTQEEIDYYQEQNRLPMEEQERKQMYSMRPKQQEQQLLINIELVNGNIIQANVSIDKFESFVSEVNTAIDNQCAIPIGQRIINGAHIVTYYVNEN